MYASFSRHKRMVMHHSKDEEERGRHVFLFGDHLPIWGKSFWKVLSIPCHGADWWTDLALGWHRETEGSWVFCSWDRVNHPFTKRETGGELGQENSLLRAVGNGVLAEMNWYEGGLVTQLQPRKTGSASRVHDYWSQHKQACPWREGGREGGK